eukprot:4035278-Amphidinium_carterae.1
MLEVLSDVTLRLIYTGAAQQPTLLFTDGNCDGADLRALLNRSPCGAYEHLEEGWYTAGNLSG